MNENFLSKWCWISLSDFVKKNAKKTQCIRRCNNLNRSCIIKYELILMLRNVHLATENRITILLRNRNDVLSLTINMILDVVLNIAWSILLTGNADITQQKCKIQCVGVVNFHNSYILYALGITQLGISWIEMVSHKTSLNVLQPYLLFPLSVVSNITNIINDWNVHHLW